MMYDAKYLKWNKIMATMIGLKPYKFHNKYLTYLHKFYCDCFLICFNIFIFTQYYEIYILIQSDILALVDNLGVSLLYTSTLFKVYVIRGNRMNDLFNNIDHIEDVLLLRLNDTLKTIYNVYVKYNRSIIIFCTLVYVFTMVPFYLIGTVNDRDRTKEILNLINDSNVYEERPLPVSSWVPFNKYKYYWTTYIWQCYAITIGGSYVYSSDCVIYTMLIFPTMLLKILQKRFNRFVDVGKDDKLCDGMDVDVAIEKSLGDCIKFHKIIIKYVNDLNVTIRYLMLFDFGIACLQMAMVAFQMITGTLGIKQLFSFEYLMAMLTQLMLCYWHADDVYYESLNIADSLWESNWIDCNNKIKRSILLIIMRTQRPLKFTVGNFYNMSVQTAVSILRATYSFVTLLRQTI